MDGQARSDTGPFALTPEWVLDADISDRAVRLYGVVGRYADDSGQAWPNRGTLAKRMRCSTDSVDRALLELQRVGALRVTPRYDEGGQTSNLYTVLRVPPPGRGRTDAEGGSRTVAERNESHLERSTEVVANAPTSAAPVTAQNIVGSWIDWLRPQGGEPPRRVTGQVARHTKALLDEGYAPEVIVEALKLMSERRLHPATLDSLILEAQMGPGRTQRRRTPLEEDYDRLRRGESLDRA